jgi:hypothetical protein
MKKKLFGFALGLGIAALAASCSLGSGMPAVDIDQAKEAYNAVQAARAEADPITGGATEGVSWSDNGTVAADLKRISTDGAVAVEKNPSTPSTYPTTIVYTFQGFVDPATGYTINGTISYVGAAPSAGSDTTDLALSNPAKAVRTLSGTVSRSG